MQFGTSFMRQESAKSSGNVIQIKTRLEGVGQINSETSVFIFENVCLINSHLISPLFIL